jgi:copper chaperone CopZ
MEKLSLHIEGMHCGACATGIQMLVSGMDGVKSIFVDYDKKTGEVEFDQVKVTQDQIFKSIAELGYTASVVK